MATRALGTLGVGVTTLRGVAIVRAANRDEARTEIVTVLCKFLWPVLVALGNGGSAGSLWTIDDGWH